MKRDEILALVGKGECSCERCRKLLARTIDRLYANGLMRESEADRLVPRDAHSNSTKQYKDTR